MIDKARLALVVETTAIDVVLDFLGVRGLLPVAVDCRLESGVARVELLCPPSVEVHRVLALGAALAALPTARGVAVVRLRRSGWLDGSRFDREVVASWALGSSADAMPERVAA